MNVLITDSELTAYAEGRLSDAEIRALEQKAIRTGQTDLLLSVIIAQHSIDKELAKEYWGEDPLDYLWDSTPSFRVAACKDEDFFKNNDEK